MSSSRLPGKHTLVCRSEMMISRLIRRVKSISSIDQIILATTENKHDDVFLQIANDNKIEIFRGSELDVMGRVLGAAHEFSAGIICEITGDCPLIDPDLTKFAIDTFCANSYNYLNNEKYGLPAGLACQVFDVDTLQHSYELVKKTNSTLNKKLDMEHVTTHIQRNPERYDLHYLVTPEKLAWPDLNLCLDYSLDFEILSEVITTLEPKNPLFSAEDILDFFSKRPDLVSKNASLYRRGYE